MWSRRQFLVQGTAVALGLAGRAAAGERRADKAPADRPSKGMMTKPCEAAIERGLAYLSSKQGEDGSFGTGAYQNNVAIISLAGLAFLAGGHVPGRGEHGKVVTRALTAVLDMEDKKTPGFLQNTKARAQQGPMYSHGFGTLFLAQLHGMVRDEKLRERLGEVLPRAVKVILDSQNKEGGWRYNPKPFDADISVTACQVMALRAAGNAGVTVPKATIDKAVTYVKNCQREDGSFVYQAIARANIPGAGAFARTAAGTCALYAAGLAGREIDAGLKYFMKNRPVVVGRRTDMHYFYGHYYAVQAAWAAGGDSWKEWFPAVRDELIEAQGTDGSWSDMICPHYGTAMACIILQAPRNYFNVLSP
jgi:hypothetical protein